MNSKYKLPEKLPPSVNDISLLNNAELLLRLQDLVKQERELLSEILHHLMIVEDRKLHLEEGYGSLFDYATKVLKYNESKSISANIGNALIARTP